MDKLTPDRLEKAKRFAQALKALKERRIEKQHISNFGVGDFFIKDIKKHD